MVLLKVVFVSVLVSLCILLVPPTQATQTVEFTYCDDERVPIDYYNVKVQGVQINPYPAQIGETANFNITASTDKAITGGKSTFTVSYRGWPVLRQTIDLCEETACPYPDFTIGDFVISHLQVLRVFTPPGTYKLKMKMEDETKRLRTCIVFDFKMVLEASVAVAAS